MLSERYLNTDIVCDIVLAVGVVPEVVAVLITINNIHGKFTKSKMEE